MDTDALDDMKGRIDAVAQALLWLTAELEMGRRINGPRLSAAWRTRQAGPGASPVLLAASQRTLAQMADALDAARAVRQSQGRR